MKIYIVLRESNVYGGADTDPQVAFSSFDDGCDFIKIMKVFYPDYSWRIEPVEFVELDPKIRAQLHTHEPVASFLYSIKNEDFRTRIEEISSNTQDPSRTHEPVASADPPAAESRCHSAKTDSPVPSAGSAPDTPAGEQR